MARRQWTAQVTPAQLDGVTLQMMLDLLTQIDVNYLRENPRTPLLYQSGVRYREEDGREEWLAIPWVIQDGAADCEDLCCWRAAELRIRGEAARCTWVAYREPDRLTYHIRVRRADGTLEDPSEILGMPRALAMVGGLPSCNPYIYRY